MRIVADYHCHTGECPLWQADSQTLYWCDIPTGRIFCWQAASQQAQECARAEESVGGMTLEADGALLCFMKQGRVDRWKNGYWSRVLPAQPQLVADRFNDVIAQPDGTVLCGTMPDAAGQAFLYHLDHRLQLNLVKDGLKLANGMGYSPDLTAFYLADTRDYRIYRFDYQLATGLPTHPRVLVDFRQRPGRPDGLTVDRSGNLWVAEIGAAQLVKFSPAGEQLATLAVPVPRVTSVLFGGVNWQELFVTSSAAGERPAGSSWGATFCYPSDSVGLPEFVSTLAC